MAEKTLTGSLEDYLEAISHLIQKDTVARVKNLADILKVRKSSVTVALRTLAAKKMIHYSPYSEITMTHKGEQAALDVIRRHETLREFFTDILGVNKSEADVTACKMEHTLPRDVTERLLSFMEFMEFSQGGGGKRLEEFKAFHQKRLEKQDLTADPAALRREMEHRDSDGLKKNNVVSLENLPLGVKAEIVAINHEGTFRRRILEMGVTVSALVTVERVAPLGDPIDIKIRGYHLSLRKEEAREIAVKILR